MVASCSREAVVTFFNNQDEAVEMSFDNRKIDLPSKSAVSLAYGNIVAGLVFKNSKGSFSFVFPSLARGELRAFWKRKNSRDVLTLQLERDSQLYLVYPDAALPSTNLSKQPDAFPLRPQLAKSTDE